MSAIKNAQQVKDLLTKTLAEDPGSYAATVNYVIVDAYQKQAQLASVLADTRRQLKGVLDFLNAAQQGAQQAQAPQGQQLPPQQGQQVPSVAPPAAPAPQLPQGSAVPPGFSGTTASGAKYVNGQRIGADGTPMTPEDQAIEERMDAAMS